MVQDLADLPLIKTVHAPQLDESQPICVPVEDNFSLIRKIETLCDLFANEVES